MVSGTFRFFRFAGCFVSVRELRLTVLFTANTCCILRLRRVSKSVVPLYMFSCLRVFFLPPRLSLSKVEILFFFVCFSHYCSSIIQNIRGSPWSHNWAHSSPTRN